jgi:hypothetical protein
VLLQLLRRLQTERTYAFSFSWLEIEKATLTKSAKVACEGETVVVLVGSALGEILPEQVGQNWH